MQLSQASSPTGFQTKPTLIECGAYGKWRRQSITGLGLNFSKVLSIFSYHSVFTTNLPICYMLAVKFAWANGVNIATTIVTGVAVLGTIGLAVLQVILIIKLFK